VTEPLQPTEAPDVDATPELPTPPIPAPEPTTAEQVTPPLHRAASHTTSQPGIKSPTVLQLAASIGCDPAKILRSEFNRYRTNQRTDGRQIWTSFVATDDPEQAAVYETVWPQ
jgi:hypothetical protein